MGQEPSGVIRHIFGCYESDKSNVIKSWFMITTIVVDCNFQIFLVNMITINSIVKNQLLCIFSPGNNQIDFEFGPFPYSTAKANQLDH